MDQVSTRWSTLIASSSCLSINLTDTLTKGPSISKSPFPPCGSICISDSSLLRKHRMTKAARNNNSF